MAKKRRARRAEHAASPASASPRAAPRDTGLAAAALASVLLFVSPLFAADPLAWLPGVLRAALVMATVALLVVVGHPSRGYPQMRRNRQISGSSRELG